MERQMLDWAKRHPEALIIGTIAVGGTALQLGLIKKEDADLNSYVARSALEGVYKIIGQAEKAIRADPAKAVGDLAKKVFGALEK